MNSMLNKQTYYETDFFLMIIQPITKVENSYKKSFYELLSDNVKNICNKIKSHIAVKTQSNSNYVF